jgi:hypothetical protein
MNWDALGAIGEVVGALAVVVTLIYLAFQVKQHTIASRVSAKQEITRQYSDFADLLLTHADLLEVYQRGLSGDIKTGVDREKFTFIMRKATWYFASMHYQYSVQSLSDDEWHQSQVLIKRVCRAPGYKHFWEAEEGEYSSNFAQYINGILDLHSER